jgi:hypothetical protein
MTKRVAIAGSIAITGLALVTCMVPVLPTGRSMRDFVALLDGAYKISQGLVPHVNFAVPHGAWPLYQAVPVLHLLHRMQPLALYQFIGWLSILPAVVIIAARQSNALRSAAILGFVAVAALVPCVVGYATDSELAYYGAYNRLGAAFLFLTLMWILTPGKTSWPQALLVAYLLFMLLAIKVTFFVAGLAILLAYGALTPFVRPLLLKSLLVLLAVLLAIEFTTGMVLAYVHDIRAMAAVNEGGLAHVALTTAVRNFLSLLAACALLVATLPAPRNRRRGINFAILRRPIAAGRLYRIPILILAATILTVLVESQSTGGIGFAFLAAFSIASLPLARRSLTFGVAASVAVLITSLTPWITNVVFHGLSVVTAQLPHAIKDPSVELLIPRTVTTATTEGIAEDYAHIWLAETNPDGRLVLNTDWMEVAEAADSALFVAQARLIDDAIIVAKQRHLISESSHTMTIGDVDYFTRVLGTKSARGIALWHNRRTFMRPSIDQVRIYLHDVDAAFAPHCGQSEGDVYIVDSFLPALKADFDRQPLTGCWDLWVRHR